VKTRKFDLNLLNVFEAIYELRNQSKAADRLFLTQPAVSVALSKLRSLMGDRLFIPGQGGLTPTKKADALYKRCHLALEGIRQEIFEVDEFDPATTFRTFSIAVSFSGGVIYAPRLRQIMKEKAPNARLVVRSLDPEYLVPDALHEHAIDVAIHYGTFDDTRLKQEAYEDDQLVLVASQNHPRIQTDPTIEDCIREEFVSYYGFFDKTYDFAAGIFFDLVNSLTVLEVPNPLVVMHAISDSELIAVSTRRMAEATKDQYRLNVFRIPEKVASLRAFLVWSKSIGHDAGHRWLLEQLSAIQSALPPLERRIL
jgi:LysR family transcriptional activator for leuABCD operon